LQFVVKYGKNQVGKLETTQEIDQGKTTYQLQSEVTVSFLMNLTEKITDIFVKEHLHHSTHTRHVNGELKADNILTWNGASYHLKNKDSEHKNIRDSIRGSVLSIYFKEPKGNETLFSQNYQVLVTLKKIAAHTYLVSLPNGNQTTYYYKNSHLDLVESKTNWGIVRFERKYQ